ncbi:MAG: hypothetical protein E2600_15420 [Chryseobacterium sp.]|nr:hypothetical protein [Chryseobacterium sp.]
MKQLFLFSILLSSLFNSQVVTDSILGKPRYVKESVLFLNGSGPFTFMEGDDEYGHAMIMIPRNLRASMKRSWFETDFCRYINNETYYDENRNITKETWYYRSGEIVDDYVYTYDHLNRLITEKSKNKYSESFLHYFYDKDERVPRFKEYASKWKDEPWEKYVNKIEDFKPLTISKFDSASKTDSVFIITNEIWKKVDDSSCSYVPNAIYQKKLSRITIYNDNYEVIESKSFNFKDDYQNKKIRQTGHFKYEYDNIGRLTKMMGFDNDNVGDYSTSIYENGKIVKKEIIMGENTWITIYNYTKNQDLERKTGYYDNKIRDEIKFEYKDNYIMKLFYLDKFGREDEQVEPTIVTFKYKFDKQKNWTEVIKNVNGRDLYKWIRKIEYY